MSEPSAKLSVVLAMSENRAIGRDNQLPWHLPADLAHFKRITLNKPIIMGRKTFESIGRALPGRTNIVMTRQSGWNAESVVTASTIDDAVARAREDAWARGADEIMVIGGAAVLEQALAICERMYLTLVDAVVEGDTFFPEYDADEWQVVSRERHSADERHKYSFSFIQMDRCLALK